MSTTRSKFYESKDGTATVIQLPKEEKILEVVVFYNSKAVYGLEFHTSANLVFWP